MRTNMLRHYDRILRNHIDSVKMAKRFKRILASKTIAKPMMMTLMMSSILMPSTPTLASSISPCRSPIF